MFARLLLIALLLAPLASAGKKGGADAEFIHRQDGKTLQQLFDAELKAARAARQQVVVVFTADWCTPCKIIKDFLDESPVVQRLARKGRVRFIDVDEWRGPAHRLLKGINPTKLPTIARVDYQGNVVVQCYGTDLGLLSAESVGRNLARLIDGKPPETPAYESDPAKRTELIRKQAARDRARAEGQTPVEVAVLERKATRGPMARWKLRITIRNLSSPRRWFAISRIGGSLAEEPQIDSWEIVKFEEHVRSYFTRFYGAPGFSVLPVAGHGHVTLEMWTEEAPATARRLEIWELQHYEVGGQRPQFDKKVPYALDIERADQLRVLKSEAQQLEVRMLPANKHVVPLQFK